MSPSEQVLQIQDQLVKSLVAELWSFVKAIWPPYWLYIVIVIALIVLGMLYQISSFRRCSDRKMPAWFNVLVGHLFYWILFYLLVTILYFIFGPQVIDGVWFGIIAYPIYRLNKIFLIWIGFWRY